MESGSNPITPKRKVEKSSKQLFKSPLTYNRNKNVTFNNDNSDPFVTSKRKPKSEIDITSSLRLISCHHFGPVIPSLITTVYLRILRHFVQFLVTILEVRTLCALASYQLLISRDKINFLK